MGDDTQSLSPATAAIIETLAGAPDDGLSETALIARAYLAGGHPELFDAEGLKGPDSNRLRDYLRLLIDAGVVERRVEPGAIISSVGATTSYRLSESGRTKYEASYAGQIQMAVGRLAERLLVSAAKAVWMVRHGLGSDCHAALERVGWPLSQEEIGMVVAALAADGLADPRPERPVLTAIAPTVAPTEATRISGADRLHAEGQPDIVAPRYARDLGR
jgi:hypothetical protein